MAIPFLYHCVPSEPLGMLVALPIKFIDCPILTLTFPLGLMETL